jgi:hypothetical protein
MNAVTVQSCSIVKLFQGPFGNLTQWEGARRLAAILRRTRRSSINNSLVVVTGNRPLSVESQRKVPALESQGTQVAFCGYLQLLLFVFLLVPSSLAVKLLLMILEGLLLNSIQRILNQTNVAS